MFEIKTSCLHYISLPQVFDNHIQAILYLYIKSYIQIFFLPNMHIGIAPKIPYQLGPAEQLRFACLEFDLFNTFQQKLC